MAEILNFLLMWQYHSEENDPNPENSGQFSNAEIKSADSEYGKRVIGTKLDMKYFTNLCSDPCDPMRDFDVVEQSEPDSLMNMNRSKHVNENGPIVCPYTPRQKVIPGKSLIHGKPFVEKMWIFYRGQFLKQFFEAILQGGQKFCRLL